MKINSYSFGTITINGDTYSKDLIIFPDRVFSPWWRKEGHLLQVSDLEEVAVAGIPVLIVGTGFFGAMKVPEETISYLESKGIKVYAEKSKKAVGLFNELSKKSRVIGAFHLTC
jgi:hypothetical protein